MRNIVWRRKMLNRYCFSNAPKNKFDELSNNNNSSQRRQPNLCVRVCFLSFRSRHSLTSESTFIYSDTYEHLFIITNYNCFRYFVQLVFFPFVVVPGCARLFVFVLLLFFLCLLYAIVCDMYVSIKINCTRCMESKCNQVNGEGKS